MAKIPRATQKLFGSTASNNQIAKFGSKSAGVPARYAGAAATAANIQALNNFLNGWFDAVIGANSPEIEDMNALFWLAFQQLGYILQTGVPEWDSGTTYFIGSVVQDGNGTQYVSLNDNNLNHAVTDTTNWAMASSKSQIKTITPIPGFVFSTNVAVTDNGAVFLSKMQGSMTYNLPAPTPGFNITIVAIGPGNFAWAPLSNQPITLHRNGSEKIQGLAQDLVLRSDYGRWKIISDGTDWFIEG